MFDPGGDSFFVEFYCIGRADVFAVTTGDAGIGYFEIIGIETFIDFDAMIKLRCALSSSFSWLCFGWARWLFRWVRCSHELVSSNVKMYLSSVIVLTSEQLFTFNFRLHDELLSCFLAL